MANLKTDSPICRRIVRAFFDFLDSVEPAPGVDVEGLEVARECLSDAFKLNSQSAEDDPLMPGLLVNLFRTLEASQPRGIPSTNVATQSEPEPFKTPGDDWTREPNTIGASKDELFGQFFAALEKNHFFKTLPNGNDDPTQLDKATCLFHEALNEMEKNGCQLYDQTSLAETLKSQGNRAMQSKLYSDAIELYSVAIGLSENNAVYYCNRAAAYTQIHKYPEAIEDCLKSIEIDQNYSKAYSRLGLAYYALGNYRDAIDKGFKKALELDTKNESVKENIRVAEQKLKEEQQWAERNQSTTSSCGDNHESNNQSARASRSQGAPPLFSFDINGIPGDIASMFRNMAGNTNPGQQSQGQQGEEERNAGGSDEPETRGGNVNLNFGGENMPEELTGALRSMMEMFSGAAPWRNPQDTMNGRSTSN